VSESSGTKRVESSANLINSLLPDRVFKSSAKMTKRVTANLLKAITVNTLMIDWYHLCNSFNNALPRAVISKLYGKRSEMVTRT